MELFDAMRPSMITSFGADDSKKDRKSPRQELSESNNENSVFVTDLQIDHSSIAQ